MSLETDGINWRWASGGDAEQPSRLGPGTRRGSSVLIRLSPRDDQLNAQWEADGQLRSSGPECRRALAVVMLGSAELAAAGYPLVTHGEGIWWTWPGSNRWPS